MQRARQLPRPCCVLSAFAMPSIVRECGDGGRRAPMVTDAYSRDAAFLSHGRVGESGASLYSASSS